MQLARLLDQKSQRSDITWGGGCVAIKPPTLKHEFDPLGDSNDPPQVLAGNNLCPGEGLLAAKSGAVDADLARVVNAWHTLPDAVKAGIVAMVKAAAGR
jgi:hypothetical protein